MIEVIKVIALLCQLTGNPAALSYVERTQQKCQSDLMKCVKGTASLNNAMGLDICIINRKVD